MGIQDSRIQVLRVLIVAEGPSEIGRLEYAGRQTRGLARGYMPPMLEKLSTEKLAIQAQRITRLGRFEAKPKPKLKGHADRAAKALALAQADEVDVLVFVTDIDRTQGRPTSALERKKKIAQTHEEIEAGFATVRDASTQTVKATPCRMIEAWALGDPSSLSHVGCTKVSAPSRPEELWGDEADPRSNHPKCVLRRVLGRQGSVEILEEIAEASDPAVLARSCPETFKPFAEEARSALRKVG
jgi:hypothetical protein